MDQPASKEQFSPQPNVKANASTPGSRNSISNVSIHDRFRLPDQLIQPLIDGRAVAVLVDVEAMSRTWRAAVERHANTHGALSARRTHDQMKVARLKAARESAVGTGQNNRLPAHHPLAGKRPFIQPQARGIAYTRRLSNLPPPGDANRSVRS